MDFIKLTYPEYKRITAKYLFAPLVVPGMRANVWILTAVFGSVSVISSGGNFEPIIFAIVFFISLGITYFVAMLDDIGNYETRKSFVAKVKQLDSVQHEMLLDEYPTARKIPIFYDKRKRVAGAETIYVTENFLFVPGLFLINREEIRDVILYGAEFRTGRVKSIFSFILEDQSKQNMMLYYSYRICPETAEQVMAWFWQCEPDDPTLPERTKQFYKSCKEYWFKKSGFTRKPQPWENGQ